MSDIIRRDPRAEWIARNRLHPLHAAMQSAQGGEVRWMGPNGLIRRNPHAVGFIGPNGVKRIDRSGGQQGTAGKRSSAPEVVQLPLQVIEQPAFYIAVVPDMVGGRLSSHDRDLLGLARKLAGEDGAVLAIVFGEHKESAFDTAGVDRLLQVEGDEYEGYAPEQRVLALRAVDGQFVPRHWLLPDSRTGGGELGRRLAASLGERPATRVWQAEGERCIGRAGAGQQDLQRPLARLILAAAECAEPVSETRHEARPVALDGGVARNLPRIEDLGPVAVDPAQIPMAEAEFILSGGNGVRDWDLFHRAAAALGATEGASRVAVDDGHMPRNRQVGATGTWVTARVYLAVGISGAIQHLQGIGACDKVVAVNMDPGCDMIKRADLSVIGDSTAILQALIRLAEEYRQGGARDAA
ncbi:electron transfer flavoprotein alpha subunit [Pseudomonas citronellolis]|uniref:electron transfer flavoprotein subunit alpha n=1 Tax=Pseudomonas citronellolis TaxID=53408 RepID=UPI00209D1616|nr:electron transfer flavoprotein subunit alpha/FixB family protein [Pseudomonas citronellolis]MCP1641069.1 electron transfer flavoprotein alpha subunit [Pseudomonas citronellolis]MCP1663987.1 electron transfer flavoprotein alpha subunit [Pseudomonas citronellolis]MCP1700656.1 electron transfer flavoprotein alpha subunit [Pseudomonas citronellolis]MCP1707035.1 electron transfer flavoprotein alpha subunit [Pseudomonas citronellolis]MCP1800818.1 electron transfer flavoprotein alpha subunit [Pseu